ncbi:hypothetical protein DAI22_03g264100 [Oryza sativa Japonica Group]|nr:hypothetical protein DAI22_03g264100 [Oryza sativa Japonica Group]
MISTLPKLSWIWQGEQGAGLRPAGTPGVSSIDELKPPPPSARSKARVLSAVLSSAAYGTSTRLPTPVVAPDGPMILGPAEPLITAGHPADSYWAQFSAEYMQPQVLPNPAGTSHQSITIYIQTGGAFPFSRSAHLSTVPFPKSLPSGPSSPSILAVCRRRGLEEGSGHLPSTSIV